ncbi:MAG: hypothetical protein COU90_03340 [Candidatus Ryanbacteria bacterium CG10_big_fil_rev_8_21_14_0_10_43_42]|uniref:Uncharacterized protein n=1 Tax=Candidatus Ryanbacteria bacterium CG10_big_fil_rev_8_21_14_0_10_43_42 TaxID=1974864 RepID=A0A2M8KWZ7_9BACT|nr:MAG: hypothetical protein COU90_03340 [Candidatus Ryanbacteria bacterium CG10_big_fil_rev_8_21_14_0_10_43_42]
MNIIFRLLYITLGLSILGSFPIRLLAQPASELVEAQRNALKTELNALESQINGFNILIDGKRSEAASLERDIAIIDAQVKKAQLEVRRRDLAIGEISSTIEEKNRSIEEMGRKINAERDSLKEAMRTLYEYDDTSVVEMLLGYDELSDFFVELDTIDSLQFAIQTSFHELRTNIITEEQVKEDLLGEKQEQTELRALQEIEKRIQQQKEQEKQNILTVTRGEQSNYQKLADEKKRRAADIRSQLFLLQGSPAIPFEQALAHAEAASVGTGVRAAFILGIIAQESELGRNIGQCNLVDDPPKYKWQNVMKPGRDDGPFLQVINELGLDPNQMPVSCPMRDSSGNRVGWGGAMGPAQFIPSTWVLYKDAVSRITGNTPANPWNPKDAFTASALLLRDNGAVSNEFKAAARYFAGGNWDSYLGRSYANQVLAKVETYQDQIDILNSLTR